MIRHRFLINMVRSALVSLLLIGQLGTLATTRAHAAGTHVEEGPGEFPSGRQPAARAPVADTYWTTEVVDPGGTVGAFSSLAIDSTDHLHVGYYDAGNTALRYAAFGGTAWVTTTVDNSASVGQYASFGLDDGDLPHISYYDATNTALKHAHWNGSWSNETVDNSASVGEYCSLGIGKTYDDVLISYYDASSQSLKVARLYSSVWISITVDAGPGVGQQTALDTTRYPHIIYYDANNAQLKYVQGTSSGWDFSESPVNHAGQEGLFTSLALDSGSDPHVSYFSAADQLVYAYHNGTMWSNTVLASVGSEATIHTAIAVDEDDVPHIAYTDDVGSGHLYYAYLDGSTWVTETVESANVNGYPSIAIDTDGYPHITYYTDSGLKHAWMRATSDLIVTDIWDDGGQIWYQVRNVGQGTAPAGHEVLVTIDEEGNFVSTIPVDLAPGERYAGVVSTWTCGAPSDVIELTADRSDVVVESDETNNVRQETWNCDTTAPQITWGPTTTLVLTDSVVIEWGTNENSDSWVYYDPSFIDYNTYEFDEGTVTGHQITLTGLEPATVYRYAVESNDLTGNRVASGESFFETVALPTDPLTGTIAVTRGSGAYPSYDIVVEVDTSAARAIDPVVAEVDTSAARAIDPVVDHVTLQVDDVLVGTAYAANRVVGAKSQYHFTISPNRLGLGRDEYFVSHDLEATIVSRNWTDIISNTFGPPREEIPVDVTLQTPLNNWVYTTDEFGNLPPGTTIQVAAEAIQYEWECEWVSFRGSDPYSMPPNCGDVAQQMDAVAFYVDGVLEHTSNSPFLDFTHGFEYNAENLEIGTHTFQALALDNDGEWRPSNARTIIVEQGEPTLSVERTVTRHGNYYEVALDISLDADAVGPAHLDYLIDYTDELMPVRMETPTYTLSIEYPLWLGTGERRARITVDFGSGGNDWIYLAPGNSYRVTYQLIPILYEDGQAHHRIGSMDLEVHYTYESQHLERSFDLTWQNSASVQAALNASDYILVTNPTRLHALYVEDEVHSLLGAMAHLATIRNGVLGFLEGYVGVYADKDEDVLRDLTQPGGYWAEALSSAFRDGLDSDSQEGYMLIVGETEVIPAFDSHNYDICWDTSWGVCVDNHGNDVYQHDQWYSTTSGNGRPELVVGRIIGNTAAQLRVPIETSIAVSQGWPGYSYQAPEEAIVFADPSEGYFWDNAQDIREILADHGWDAVPLRLPEENPDTLLEALIDDGWSLIHLRGHGSPGSWSNSALSAGSPVDFGGYAPFVFGTTCLTGKYEGNNDDSLAENMLQSGAAVYIGATQVSPSSKNSGYSKWFYEHDWNPESNEPIGRAFAQLERDKYESPDLFEYDFARFWVVEYNLYGDPRFGASAPVLSRQATVAAATAPTTTLTIQVPAYVVTTTVDGFDQVEIPGGRTLFENGLHEIPYWTTSVDYAPGYRVQDVTLDVRAGYAFTTGLELPTAVMTYYTNSPVSGGTTQTLSLTEDDDWFPALDEIYDWDATLNPDGSSELVIHIFPFHYQPATTNVEWYDVFTFTIDVISTTIQIDGFELGTGTYDPGDVITGDLWFENPGDAQDLILDVTVRNLVTGEVVDGLLLNVLHDTVGLNHYNVEWDSSGFDPGEYLLWVDLLDSEGQWLDSASEMFRLGAPSAEISAFSATPGLFQPGDGVDISMTISNTGSIAVSGEAIVKVYATGVSTPTAIFTQTVTDLAPAGTIVFNDVWDTTAVEGEEYRIIGYMKYDARTTEVETVFVSTRAYIYLPLVLR